MKVLNLLCNKCGHMGLIIKEFLVLSVIAHCQKCGERHYFDKEEIRDWFEADLLGFYFGVWITIVNY